MMKWESAMRAAVKTRGNTEIRAAAFHLPNAATWFWLVAVLTCLFLLPPSNAWSQDRRVITLKNGLDFEGLVGDIKTYNLEVAASDPFDTNKKIALIDDGLRRVFVCYDHIANTAPSNFNAISLDIYQETLTGAASDGYANQVLRIGPINEFGHRVLDVIDENDKHQTFALGITKVTPKYVEFDTLRREDSGNKSWNMRVATNSIPPALLLALMNRQISDTESPTTYWRIFDILTEARLYNLALDQLKLIESRFPDLEEDIKSSRTAIKALNARQILEEMRQRRDVGQPELARAIAQVIVTEGMGEDRQLDFQDFQLNLDRDLARVDSLRSRCGEVVSRFMEGQGDPARQDRLREFLTQFEAGLSLNTIDRFAGFDQVLSVPGLSDESLSAQIISRWYLGSSKIEENFAISESLIPVHTLVREYFSVATDEARRAGIVAELKGYEGGAPEYLAPLLAQMLPPQPAAVEDYNGSEPFRNSIAIPGIGLNAAETTVDYFVHLPPEYDPYRKYPLLVVLPGLGPAEQTLNLWTGDFNPRLGVRQGFAPRNGYITLTVEWKAPGQNLYGYSARETLTVLKSIRDAFQHFSIDSDRVFVAGIGPGGDAAYDIAISHPDIFSGVVGISGKIERYPEIYNENKHFGLGVYSVVGEKDIATRRSSAKTWDKWLQRDDFNQLVLVEYRGRLPESFYEEFPAIFRWMSTQTRRLPNLASEIEINCEVFRPWDNRYYFFEFLGLPSDATIWPEFWRTSGYENTMRMQLEKKGNRFFNVRPSGRGEGMLIGLSPEYVDMNQEIEISGRGDFKGFVTPSITTMLEDVRVRGDRQHPIWAQLETHGNERWRAAE